MWQFVVSLLVAGYNFFYISLQKLEGYSNPAGGHLIFISHWNLQIIIIIKLCIRTEECIRIKFNYGIGFRDAVTYSL